MVSFKFKAKKFASVVAYLAARKTQITKKELCKLIYFADKEHLLRYGRPITGDRYYAFEQGPVPTRGLDALNGRNKYPEDDAEVAKYGKLRGWTFQYNGVPADLKALSKSDIEVLDRVFQKIGHLPAWELERLSHKDPAWAKAEQNGPMDFELFFEGSPEAATVKEVVLEESGMVA
jgi:uncharacterized phage-associated protein